MRQINRQTNPILNIVAAACLALAFIPMAQAADAEINITIEHNHFIPAEIKAPAGQRIKLMVLNKDATPEEFESGPLKVEKIISGGKRGLMFIGPLAPGRYPFFGEFHKDTAQGVLIAE
ncbi:MAG: cupredoxin domain-containing protein [Pseudomonadota bacterium]